MPIPKQTETFDVILKLMENGTECARKNMKR